MGQARFTRARNACNDGQALKWDLGIDCFEVVRLATNNIEKRLFALNRTSRLDAVLNGGTQVLPSNRLGVVANFLYTTCGDNLPPLDPSAGAHINNVIRGTDGVLVMLDYH